MLGVGITFGLAIGLYVIFYQLKRTIKLPKRISYYDDYSNLKIMPTNKRVRESQEPDPVQYSKLIKNRNKNIRKF